MKIYDIVKKVLIAKPETRNNNKLLIWEVWNYKGRVGFNFETREPNITKNHFLSKKTPDTASILRARRKVVEHFPQLNANDTVKAFRDEKRLSKGTFIYREEY